MVLQTTAVAARLWFSNGDVVTRTDGETLFPTRSVPRCYNQDKLAMTVIALTAFREEKAFPIIMWCSMCDTYTCQRRRIFI
jgi:hypothetical protein